MDEVGEDDLCSQSEASSDVTSVRSTFEDRFNLIIQRRQVEENDIIERVVAECTFEVDANVAEVMDTNTFVSDDIIQEWRSKVVMARNGTIHNKQTLLNSIHNPAGMMVSSTPLSMDRSSRVQGKCRHGGKMMTEEGTSVTRAVDTLLVSGIYYCLAR